MTEYLTASPARAFAALVDVPVPDFDAGEGLPLLWHWFYLLDRPATADLGRDGHPVRHVVAAPPEPGRRRMWAGGTVRSLAPLRVEQPATRRSRVLETVDKTGRSGPMTFVTVRHEISQGETLCVEEDHNIVYRQAAAEAPGGGSERTGHLGRHADAADWDVDTPITLLFRFSALTYNGHRIHYDRDYARDVEGYPGLVVHGPLQAILMAEHLRRRVPTAAPGNTFRYRLLSPAFDGDGLMVSSRSTGADGGIVASVHTRAGLHTATATREGADEARYSRTRRPGRTPRPEASADG